MRMVDWPHAPLHRFENGGIYFVTASTYLQKHVFRESVLEWLQQSLFAKATEHDCHIQAWSLFSNHYHIVVNAGRGAQLHKMLTRFHVETAIEQNRRDGARGRKVWYQFREAELTFERSWLARLRYTHENAVHHGLVSNAENYRWCSASWFASTARWAFVQTVREFPIDRLHVDDEFDVGAAASLPDESGG